MRRTFVSLFAVLTFAAYAAPVKTVILVRHAEKAAVETDPPLTVEGEARAKNLARLLSASGITAIYTTPFARTRNTAEPIATALKLTPVEVKTGATYAADVVARIQAEPAGATILVVGHSNTTQHALTALGIANAPKIEDTEHDNLFVVTLGDEPKMLVLKY
jgi:broad specificity phosphatase PhoE